MKLSNILLGVGLIVGSTSAAHADPVVAQETETVTASSAPSRPMLASGIVTFGLAYVPSVVVAATSDRGPDHRLFVPLAGPWMALPGRGDCGAGTGRSCNAEASYKVLLVADGVVQALGALVIVRSFFTPEVHTVSTTTRAADASPSLRVAPTAIGSGYGIGAVGTF